MGSYILDVPYKSNGKSAQFFDDRLEFKGNSIRYDEIEILTATRGNTTINTYVGISTKLSCSCYRAYSRKLVAEDHIKADYPLSERTY